MGIDVFSSNPCDALGRVFDYSPLWLVADVLPVTADWVRPAGLLVDLAFISTLSLLPPGRGRWQVAILVACSLSTPVAFALERANNDLIVFVLAALAAALAARHFRWRLVGYLCALLAGMLKYYPLLLLLLICRERLVVAGAVSGAAALVLFGGVGLAFADLHRALPLIPTGQFFGDMFGVSTLPLGLTYLWGLPPIVAQMGLVTLIVVSALAALRFGLSTGVGRDVAGLTERERLFLLAGALLILGCFFAAQNIGYRALHLLLAAPALTALATIAPRRRVYRVSVFALVILLWAEGWRHWVDAAVLHRAPWETVAPAVGTSAQLLAWCAREACWWWLVTVLAGLSFSVLLASPVGQAALPTLWRQLSRGAAPGGKGGEQAGHLGIAPEHHA